MADRAVDQGPGSREGPPPRAGRQPPATRPRVAGSRTRSRTSSTPTTPPSSAPLTARRPTARAAVSSSVPPPRPAVTGDVPVPSGAPRVTEALPRKPTALRLSAGSWFAACAAGLVGVGAALADGPGLRDRLSVTAAEVDPTAGADAISDAVAVTILLVLGAVVALVALTLVWTALLLRRRSWTRWALLVTGLLTLFAADVAQSTVAGGNDLDRIALVTQLGLIVLALVLLFLRSSRRWLRGSDD